MNHIQHATDVEEAAAKGIPYYTTFLSWRAFKYTTSPQPAYCCLEIWGNKIHWNASLEKRKQSALPALWIDVVEWVEHWL